MKQPDFNRRDFIKTSTISVISATPVARSLAQLFNVPAGKVTTLIDYAFRLSKWQNLLNIDFYFVNVGYRDQCIFRKRKLIFNYQEQKSFMIVRLPQQHIAEQSYDASYTPNGAVFNDNNGPGQWTAVTRIAGYSYLVFRIIFPDEKNKKKILLTEESLMNWNDTSLYKLVVKQNMTESLFDIEIEDGANISYENRYPLNYSSAGEGGVYAYDYDAYPKAYGDPVTAIEAPWRLFLSPKLPDQDRFRFRWEFSAPPVYTRSHQLPQTFRAELWTASLTIEENPDYLRLLALRRSFEKKKDEDNHVDTADAVIGKIELMLIGSPDHPNAQGVDAIFTTAAPYRILPAAADRKDLVELYIKYKIVARTNKLIFSPLGISTFIEFKNDKIDTDKINLYQWKQLISFGRDEEVEVVTLCLEKEHGHKYLHIKTTKRRTKQGVSYLDYREYVMPLEISKDLRNHTNEHIGGKLVTKFASPFNQIYVLDTQPKRIAPLSAANYNTPGEALTDAANAVLAFIPKAISIGTDGQNYKENVEFQYKGVDWQGNVTLYKKSLQLIPLETIQGINKLATPVLRAADIKRLESFFSSDKLESLNLKLAAFETSISAISKRLSDLETTTFQPATQLNRIKALLVASELNKSVQTAVANFKDRLKTYETDLGGKIDTLNQKLDAISALAAPGAAVFNIFDARVAIPAFTALENEIGQIDLLPPLPDPRADRVIHKLTPLKTQLLAWSTDLTYADLRSLNNINIAGVPLTIYTELYTNWGAIQALEKDIPNLINTYKQKVGFAVKDFRTTAEQQLKTETDKKLGVVKEELSMLQANWMAFNGQLKTDINNQIDFFHEYAAMPQLQQASVFISSLNKLVNEEIPVNIQYAQDYLKNQLDQQQLEVEKNASRVFAELTTSAKAAVNGKIRQISADMGGYINPEIPVEYLTYLKDPKKLSDKLVNDILQQYPELKAYKNEIQEQYNDLVFISNTAKEQWKKIQAIKPEAYFAALEAKILGSISLKDILGVDFEMPRLTNYPDKIVYNFITDKIVDKDLGVVYFYAQNRGQKTSLQIYLEKSTKDLHQALSFTRLSNFSLSVRVSSADVLVILFNKLEVSASNQGKSTTVKIDDISFGGPLEFLAKLAEAIQIPGTGLHVNLSAANISIGYAFALPGIESPGFNFTNIKFDVGLNIPLPTFGAIKPISTTIGINSPFDKFLISVGIFGGRGHFQLTATPDSIQKIDSSLEFGGYLGINLGIASGYVYLFAGIRFVYYGDGDIIFDGYLICGGGVTVFGFISVSVTFLLIMEYQNVGGQASLTGSASVSYSIKIGFFKKSFTLSYSKTIAGTGGKRIDPNSQASLVNKTSQPIYYADAGPELIIPQDLLRKEQTATPKNINTTTKDSLPDNAAAFKNVYTETTWNEYLNSFIRS
ncbi:hypothetical protein ACFS5N_04580 [Mucilaginibacter ximonensis]|uniref:Uncharacterized protein n=1 Tax=Mucilaginibacter ximonensis TaxID=538021 RepID=A0ABW5Y8W6_9SPHI